MQASINFLANPSWVAMPVSYWNFYLAVGRKSNVHLMDGIIVELHSKVSFLFQPIFFPSTQAVDAPSVPVDAPSPNQSPVKNTSSGNQTTESEAEAASKVLTCVSLIRVTFPSFCKFT